MILRKPDIGTGSNRVVWSRVPEFANYWNGASAVIPYVEFYLNSVMNEVRQMVAADNPALKEHLDLFIAQERNHAQYHVKFNKRLFAAGFSALKPLIDTIVGELRTLRETRSLAFNVAYCAGFENAATFSSRYLLEECDADFAGADGEGANLFLWHVAEEFEHRAVCHQALHAVSDSYFMRIAGVTYAFWHINHSFARAAKVIFAVVRADMSPAERKASQRIVRAIRLRQFRYTLPRILLLLNPRFDPARIASTPRIDAALEYFRRPGPLRESFVDHYARATAAPA